MSTTKRFELWIATRGREPGQDPRTQLAHADLEGAVQSVAGRHQVHTRRNSIAVYRQRPGEDATPARRRHP